MKKIKENFKIIKMKRAEENLNGGKKEGAESEGGGGKNVGRHHFNSDDVRREKDSIRGKIMSLFAKSFPTDNGNPFYC